MNRTAQTITNRLSLRPPQKASLEILSKLADELDLQNGVDLTDALKKVHELYPTCSNFERDFPSLTFALATGVGKTRLMGAFIAYLHIEKGINNFFVLAPGTTIYNKLVEDFSDPNNPKYVFNGISEFAQNPPRIITSDNYSEARQATLFNESVKINVFNIQRISSEMRGGREPRIKRLSEYLGESYFSYLSELSDLVVLMDESHHYRADAGMKAINELKAVLGLELTATPIDTRGTKFKNVVYEYSLARALDDGYLKEPAVATRRDFDPDQYRNDPKELDLIKLEDGIRIHEDTKVALDIFARDTGNKLVKPFILVVAKDTTHAEELKEMIESNKFFEGRYKGKVMEIHSNLRGGEKEENVKMLMDLEKPENTIEIVIHVNMLKEGWDVTNLYTIIPLRAANSQILTEQTLGRGLRLPFGKRTGEKKADTLTIIAHDRFQAIVEAANDPNSIIRNENIIEIDPNFLPDTQSIITSSSTYVETLQEQRVAANELKDPEKKQEANINIQAKQALFDTVSNLGDSVTNMNDLNSAEVKKVVFEKLIERVESAHQQNLFKQEIIEAAKKEYEEVVKEVIQKIIPIPRILIQQSNEVAAGFHDFDLDAANLNYQPVSEEILRTTLRTHEFDILHSEGTGVVRDTPVNILVNELINYPDIDYDQVNDLLYKLAGQAVEKLGAGRDDDDLRNIVLYHKREIAKFMYVQLKKHFYLEQSGFEEPVIHAFTKIEPWNFSMYTKDKVHHYSETIQPTNTIPTKVFGGFKKACHNLYKFDSKAEKDLTTTLETDNDVLRWLRPAQAQFRIYWKHNSRRYVPDFVVETSESIYMIEVKAEKDIEEKDVMEKAEAAKEFCKAASEYSAAHKGKPWNYILIPHTVVRANMSFKGLLKLNAV
ncbi:DEAD/DEAH box helicase family protein [Candidatus Woesebacteria bacterium]|nr:DEAD/DEAH box helicase family protein [Candidatus Woesebacteria bacterium]